MSKPTIYGFPQSSYVWTTRAGFAVKGVDYDFVPITPGEHKQPDHIARHPYGKVPAMVAGDFTLYESSAILRWLDATQEGAKLFPTEGNLAGQVEQWVSVVNGYVYKQVVLDWLFKYMFTPDGKPDTAALEEARPKLAHSFKNLNDAIGDGPWIAGDSITAADLFIGPLAMALTRFDDGKQILGENPKVQRLVGALAETPAFMSGAPQQPAS